MAKNISAPRVVIAATGSGRGKTTFVSALLALLKRCGENVRAFKCGPDYIDPMFHESVLGIPSKNLDTYFCGPELIKASFYEDSGDINIIEGVMGLYDGIGMTSESSTYELAQMLKAPIILCIDAHGMGISLAAEIKGFKAMDKDGLIKGIFLNRISEMYFKKIAPWLESECGIPVVGFLPNMPEVVLKSRHLGLETPEETEAVRKLGLAADKLEKTLDLAKLKSAASSAPELTVSVSFDDLLPPCKPKAVIAVAKDDAFTFFYKDNLNALKKAGADIRFFSPMKDEHLPENTQGIVLYGGYPELFAKELEANSQMRAEILKACNMGMPVIAECGGFMYLQEKIRIDGNECEMVGFFKGCAHNEGRLVRFGYVSGAGKAGDNCSVKLRGHEFHHFDVDDPGSDWNMIRNSTKEEYKAMHRQKGVIAGFPHYYYYSDVNFIKGFIKDASEFRAL